MPELSRFYGIIVRMYFGDHDPPHVHVEYSGSQAVVTIETLALIGGTLPPRALGLVAEWGLQHRAELLAAWARASRLEQPGRIPPLP